MDWRSSRAAAQFSEWTQKIKVPPLDKTIMKRNDARPEQRKVGANCRAREQDEGFSTHRAKRGWKCQWMRLESAAKSPVPW